MYNIQGVSLIVSTSTVALSQRNPASARTSRERIWRNNQYRETQTTIHAYQIRKKRAEKDLPLERKTGRIILSVQFLCHIGQTASLSR
jgi:hypothetical protein